MNVNNFIKSHFLVICLTKKFIGNFLESNLGHSICIFFKNM